VKLKINIWPKAFISLNIYFNYIIVIIMAFDLQNLRKEFKNFQGGLSMERIMRFFKEEDGLEMSEYALMGALICVAVAVTVILLRDAINGALNNIIGAFG
jgi:Flp pilus assembly pilin Flp